jgi:hypothetical protein
MKLKDELAELEARRTGFTAMVNDPRLTDQERALWEERLAEVLAVQAAMVVDMLADRIGYLTWAVADDNEPLRRQTHRFPQ